MYLIFSIYINGLMHVLYTYRLLASILRHFTEDDKGHLHYYAEVRG